MPLLLNIRSRIFVLFASKCENTRANRHVDLIGIYLKLFLRKQRVIEQNRTNI